MVVTNYFSYVTVHSASEGEKPIHASLPEERGDPKYGISSEDVKKFLESGEGLAQAINTAELQNGSSAKRVITKITVETIIFS